MPTGTVSEKVLVKQKEPSLRSQSPVYVNAFLKELEENGIQYDLQDVHELELPNIKLPWTE